MHIQRLEKLSLSGDIQARKALHKLRSRKLKINAIYFESYHSILFDSQNVWQKGSGFSAIGGGNGCGTYPPRGNGDNQSPDTGEGYTYFYSPNGNGASDLRTIRIIF